MQGRVENVKDYVQIFVQMMQRLAALVMICDRDAE